MKNYIDYLAEMCHYAQSHCGDPIAWPSNRGAREDYFQCTSFVVSCILAQHTKSGHIGVEWDIIINELCDNTTDVNGMMCKSIAKWKTIINNMAEYYGGWV